MYRKYNLNINLTNKYAFKYNFINLLNFAYSFTLQIILFKIVCDVLIEIGALIGALSLLIKSFWLTLRGVEEIEPP